MPRRSRRVVDRSKHVVDRGGVAERCSYSWDADSSAAWPNGDDDDIAVACRPCARADARRWAERIEMRAVGTVHRR